MSDLESLCRACGLCCDGTLFTRVPLAPDEAVPEAKLGVVRTQTGARFVPQRCAALAGTVCQVYGERPLACRRYECLLFGALREGEVSLAAALEVVGRAQALAAAAREDPDAVGAREDSLRFHFGRRP